MDRGGVGCIDVGQAHCQGFAGLADTDGVVIPNGENRGRNALSSHTSRPGQARQRRQNQQSLACHRSSLHGQPFHAAPAWLLPRLRNGANLKF